MCITKDFCWRACPVGIKHGHWQLHSTRIASQGALIFSWPRPVRLINIAIMSSHVSSELHQVNQLSESFLGRKLLPYHHALTQHNEGEYFGVEYLYRQAGRQLVISEDSTQKMMRSQMGWIRVLLMKAQHSHLSLNTY